MNSKPDDAKIAKRVAPRTARGACLLLLRAIVRLVAGWWRSDRIRVSPREGELLRLGPGSVVTVNGIVAEIRLRAIIQASGPVGVRYECQTENGSARLEVQSRDGDKGFEITWSAAGRNQPLLECQIEVFG